MGYYIDKEGKYRGEYTRLDLVERYELIEVPIAPSSELLTPIWNGLQWIEGATEQELQVIKQNKIDELNKLQFDELLVTDWAFIRRLEEDTEIPLEIVNERNEIRAKYNNLKNEL